MSFCCQKCNTPQKPKTRPVKVSTLFRKKFYPVPVAKVFDEETMETTVQVVGRKGYGHEIVKQENMCESCASTVVPNFV